jgi:uncharacterized protein YciI
MTMTFVLICQDKPDHLQTRIDTRAAHLDHIESSGIVMMAGPFLEDGRMCGSIIVLDTPDRAAAEAWAKSDPYALAGLFDRVEIREWKKVIG